MPVKNTEQLLGFLHSLWQHKRFRKLCDFTLTCENGKSMRCHKVVLSASSLFFADYKSNALDVSPLPLDIVKTVVCFMYRFDCDINSNNVFKVLTLSLQWDLQALSKVCVAYIHDNIVINNVAMFTNLSDQTSTEYNNLLIRQHLTGLCDDMQISLSSLSLKKLELILEQDDINVKKEDMTLIDASKSVGAHAINKNMSQESLSFQHASGNLLVQVILNHPLMQGPIKPRQISEAFLYQLTKPSLEMLRPCKEWPRGIFYIGQDHSLFRYADDECSKLVDLPPWVNDGSSISLYKEHLLIVGGWNGLSTGDRRAMLLDTRDYTTIFHLPLTPQPTVNSGVLFVDKCCVYVFGGHREIYQTPSVYCLVLGNEQWQVKKPMPYAVANPLVVQHEQSIFVLGGTVLGVAQSRVLEYSISDDTWMEHSEMPVACSSLDAGVFAQPGVIYIVTVDKVVFHAFSRWHAKPWKRFGVKCNAFLKQGQIWGVVQCNGTHDIVSYDCKMNEWVTEQETMGNVCDIRLFC